MYSSSIAHVCEAHNEQLETADEGWVHSSTKEQCLSNAVLFLNHKFMSLLNHIPEADVA